LRKKLLGTAINTEIAPEGSARERSLGEEILGVVLMEAPIIAIVLGLAMILGYCEGWTWFER
jgi:hypothetical protein